jgi:hypothetical protein
MATIISMKPCRLDDLSGWLEEEADSIPDESHRRVVLDVNANLDSFVKWPERAELLWEGCDRRRKDAQQQRYHKYPEELKSALPSHRFTDGRSNGPAIAAYQVAGGERPSKSNGHGWNIHHLYDGKFPYPGNTRDSLRAVTGARHFTQSAGLVAVHPVADALADEVSIFAWRLRGESFRRFGYDPEGVFSQSQDKFGFYELGRTRVWHVS